MAFNLATFKTRSLTAVVFVIVMLAGLLINQWSFFILFSVIHFGCWIEYQKLVSKIDPGYAQISPVHKYGVMIAGWLMMFCFTDELFKIGNVWLHLSPWWPLGVFIVSVLADLLLAKTKRPKNIAHSIFGVVYISLSCALMIDMYHDGLRVPGEYGWSGNKFMYVHSTFNWFVPAFIIACMWINDTMAYIVGSLIGRTPFSKISPKKTWEGTIGGIILCILIAGFLAHDFFQYGMWEPVRPNRYHWFIMAGIASIAGTAGDLLESKLKRLAGVKDSGHIMPGHGGFLDRFDSLLVATPFVWLYLQFGL